MELLLTIFCKLQAISMYYKTAHWQSKNAVFYSDHLLFDRLYDSSYEHIDDLAERIIGKSGQPQSIDLPIILKKVYETIKILPYSPEENIKFFEASLTLEEELLSICQMYDSMEDSTVGCRNLIGSISDSSEGRVYLLKQRIPKKEQPQPIAYTTPNNKPVVK